MELRGHHRMVTVRHGGRAQLRAGGVPRVARCIEAGCQSGVLTGCAFSRSEAVAAAAWNAGEETEQGQNMTLQILSRASTGTPTVCQAPVRLFHKLFIHSTHF